MSACKPKMDQVRLRARLTPCDAVRENLCQSSHTSSSAEVQTRRRGIESLTGVGVDAKDGLVSVGSDAGDLSRRRRPKVRSASPELERCRRTTYPPHRVKELVLERRHALVKDGLLEEAHEDDL